MRGDQIISTHNTSSNLFHTKSQETLITHASYFKQKNVNQEIVNTPTKYIAATLNKHPSLLNFTSFRFISFFF